MSATTAVPQKSRIDPNVRPIDPAKVSAIRLPGGRAMPVAAYGTFHSDWAQKLMKDATVEAIRLGWRHLDTARAYENESDVGTAIREAIQKGLIRSKDELFITGKLWNGHMHPRDVAPALDATLKALGLEQIDLYLNHWPWPNVHTPGCGGDHRNPDAVPYIHEQFMETWAELVKLKKAGKIVHLGTSNHTAAHMRLLMRDVRPDERPVVNQMEMHPLLQQTELRRYFESQGVVCTGYMALASPKRPSRDRFKVQRADMEHPVIVGIARELNVSPARVCLSWAVQRMNHSGGFVAMTTQSTSMRDNLLCATDDLLSPEQMLQIDGDGSADNPGIDADNRLIFGQVFLWPEADGDWRMLWNDQQVFETRKAYARFKKAYEAFDTIRRETTLPSNESAHNH